MNAIHSTYTLFFFNDTATTEIYTLSLHDALPICLVGRTTTAPRRRATTSTSAPAFMGARSGLSGMARQSSPCTKRSEEHTSELQSRQYLVCRLLLEKKKIRKEPFVGTAGLNVSIQ